MDKYIPQPVVQVLTAVGLLFIAAKVFALIRLFSSYFILPGTLVSDSVYGTIRHLTCFQLTTYGPKGSWVVITGASDGIGKEFAIQLGRKGYNLVLVSRTQSKLDTLVKDLKEANPSIETKILAMDFSANKDADFEKLKALVAPLDVSILVNNVGQSHSIPVTFLETEKSEMDSIITINCIGTLRVTQIVAPGMVSRKHGLILTMASFGGIFPTPLLATYSGSKAFLQQWGTALAAELAPSGVKVVTIQSHLVTSAMSKIRRASVMVPTPKAFVRATLGKIGRSGGSQGIAHTLTPWWAHGFFQWFVTTTVGTMSHFALAQNLSMHKDIRRRALARAAREGKKTN
jgi:17beta-estradiol 17-dehydrogenase / very-long-chain 3-oxoacyl-CoA reductase